MSSGLGQTDEDSSSDEEDEEEDPIHVPLVFPRQNGGDDDEDELEFFGAAAAQQSSFPPPPPPPLQAAAASAQGLNLVDAMSASVNAVERGLLPPRSFDMTDLPPAPAAQKMAESFATAQTTTPEVFGIAYKPYGKASRRPTGYALPTDSNSNADLEDEAISSLAARQLSAVAAASSAQAEEDDDFDFSEDAAGTADAVKDAVRCASERAAQEEAADAADIVAGLKSEAHAALALALEQSSPNKPGGKLGRLDATLGIRKAAEEAMSAIAQAYGSGGTGDLEVEMWGQGAGERVAFAEAEAEAEAVAAPVSGGTIEEGDEEAAERQEEEEERAKLAHIQESLRVKTQLEADWQGLEEASVFHPATEKEPLPTWAPAENTPPPFQTVGYKKALAYLKELDLSQHQTAITMTAKPQQQSWSSSLFSLVGANTPTKLQLPDAEKQLAWPFLVAQVDYDPSIPMHLALLRTIFDILVPETLENVPRQGVPVTGPHWDKVGFQGLDPRTDINRSMKMFALLQALHLVTQRTSEAQRLHALSTKTASVLTNGQDLSWPFMCVSILFTKEAIQALRSGSLHRLCNESKDVVSVLHDFHHACFHEFGRRLSTSPSVHHAVHLAAIRKLCEGISGGLALVKAYMYSRIPEDSQIPKDLVEFSSIDEMVAGGDMTEVKHGREGPSSAKAAKFVV